MKRGDILFFLISISILVFAWIGFSIYHNLAKSTISETLGTQIIPIKSDFDTQTIEQLKKRKQIVPILEIGQPLQGKEATPSVAPRPSPTSTPSATPTPSQTGGAKL